MIGQSTCCKAPVLVHSSEEDTSFYMCAKCAKPCDVYADEQVSVDEKYQLKRLDENVKKLIQSKKEHQLYFRQLQQRGFTELDEEIIELENLYT